MCHNVFLRYRVELPSLPEKDLFIEALTYALSYSEFRRGIRGVQAEGLEHDNRNDRKARNR